VASRPPGLRRVLRPVDAVVRLGQPDQAVALAHALGERVTADVGGVQDHPYAVGDLPGGQPLGRRVHRDQLLGELPRGVGGVSRDHLVLRVDQLPFDPPPGPVEAHLSGEEPPRARRELALGDVRALAEERQGQPPAAVGDGDLEDVAGLTGDPPALDLFHLGHHRDVFTLGEAVQVGQLATLGVTPRIVAQQVPGGLQVEGGESLGRLRSHRLDQWLLECRHRTFLTSHPTAGHRHFYRLPRPSPYGRREKNLGIR
jgi:hypothetical protein